MSGLELEPIDQKTGKGRDPERGEGTESLIGNGNERLRNTLTEGRRWRGRAKARLREKRRAAEKAKAERKSRMNECLRLGCDCDKIGRAHV